MAVDSTRDASHATGARRTCRARPLTRLAAAGLAAAALVAASAPGGEATAGRAPDAAAATPPALPFETDDPRARALFLEGRALERAGDFAAASIRYEQALEHAPGAAHLYWRIARNHYRAGTALPMADEEGRRLAFERAERWAERGAEQDPRCAECFLYQFIALSSQARLRGTWSAARNASRMGELLERALELGPTHVDDPRNHELANLYFAAGIFYKVVPDSALAEWTLGVRGDRARSRAYYRKAVEITDTRIDYLVSLGSALLCEGRREDDPAKQAEGRALLRRIGTLEDYLATDAIYRDHAETLLARPEEACDYSGEEWRRRAGR